MGTSPTVMTARQQGKSYAATHAMSVFFDEIEQVKRTPKPITYTFDPLAFTLASLDSGMSKSNIVDTLGTENPKGVWIAEFDQQANDIRKYYRNKLMLRTLKHSNIKMSKFRQDLYNYVESNNPYTIDRNDIPMIVKLPDFYAEDKMMDQFVKDYVMDSKHYQNQTAHDSLTLYPMRKFHRKTQSSDLLHYWFCDDANLVYRIDLEPKNPCVHLFEREFANSSIKFNTLCNLIKTRGQPYAFYKLNKWEIL